MSDTVRLTFLFALGDAVRWAERPGVRWKVYERCYRDGMGTAYVRYRLMAETPQDAMAYEADLTPWEETP